MSTLKSNITAKRLALLAQNDEKIFHIKDLASLWNIKNPNTLRITLKRYVEEQLIYRIYRGFYSLVPLDKIPPLLLGAKALHRYCYVSTETVLSNEGYINQIPYYYTFVSERRYQFSINGHHFSSRQLNKKFLYHNEGVYEEDGLRKATVERAIADMLYFNSKYYFDKEPDWDKINLLQKKIGYPIT